MTVAVNIDARRLQDTPLGGVGRALACMLPGIGARCEVTLLTDARRPPASTELAQVPLSSPRRAPETVWLHHAARRWQRRHGGLFHGTFGALPIALRDPAVVTIYDLSFEVHPEDFGPAKRRLFRWQARAAAARAAAVITASRFSADQIADRYGVPPERLAVIPLGVDPTFRRPVTTTELARALPGPYVAAVGGAPRRGLGVAVEAWRRVRRAGVEIDLVVVGEGRLPAEPGLHDLGRIGDADWASVLAGAEALCFPTRYEGFGLPALEAAASGTPVVCARVASLPEVLGDAAAWCEGTTVEEVADRLHDVLTDPALAEALRQRGLAAATSAPTWDSIAARHVEVYEAAA